MGHTVLPYVTAYMSPSQAKTIRLMAIQSRTVTTEVAALVRLLTRGSRFFKACPLCIQEDIEIYGESYWRRSHLLPGVYVCPAHHSVLLEVTTLGTRRTYRAMGAGNPSLIGASTVPDLPDSKLLEEISNLSVKAISADWNHRTDWWLEYRRLAISKGYCKVERHAAGSPLSKDLGSSFGAAFLRTLGCSVNVKLGASWPSLMLKPRTGVPFAPVKHILLATFLATCPEREKALQDRMSNKSNDINIFDVTGSQRVRSVWAHAAEHQARLSVKDLLEAAGVWSKFRNSRGKCPAIADSVSEFRRSEQAKFPLGRPR